MSEQIIDKVLRCLEDGIPVECYDMLYANVESVMGRVAASTLSRHTEITDGEAYIVSDVSSDELFSMMKHTGV